MQLFNFQISNKDALHQTVAINVSSGGPSEVTEWHCRPHVCAWNYSFVIIISIHLNFHTFLVKK